MLSPRTRRRSLPLARKLSAANSLATNKRSVSQVADESFGVPSRSKVRKSFATNCISQRYRRSCHKKERPSQRRARSETQVSDKAPSPSQPHASVSREGFGLP